MSIENTLWVEKYRPKTLDDLVGNDEVKAKLKHWLDQNDVPNLLLFGGQGQGKTSISKLIGKSLDADVLYINASDENSVDVIRDKIKSFVSTVGFGQWKIVLLDECDFMTQNAQAALRNVIETYSQNSRFIATCNQIERIIPPIQSRFVTMQIETPDRKSVALRCKYILDTEQIKYDINDVVSIINRCYPDQRKIIQTLQSSSSNGQLKVDEYSKLISNYCDKILTELKSIKDIKSTFTNIRQIIADAKVRQFDDLFRFLFDNLSEFVPDGKKASCILYLADAQQKAAVVTDPEIQVAAMFVNLLKELK